ncbi:MAG: M20/M25/M40 family metallo-hydrolase [Terriglobales bacterium]
MNTKLLSLWLALAMTVPAASVAQQRNSWENRSARRDPQIADALQQVSADRLQASVEKLASFRSRNTLSSPGPKDNEIGAARAWIKAEFERYSQACGGCLEVRTDSFIAPSAPRIPQPTEIVNVYAVLRGADPRSANRIYVIVGHYDSRAGDVLDPHAPAPGANDDASGTAVVLEAARVLSALRLPATVIFLAVAGEEQGLHGARHFAKMAREQNWDIGAVLNNDTVGGDKGPGQDASVLRVFSEGIPSKAGEADVRLIRSMGAENDSPSRQLARYLREVDRVYLPGAFGPKMIFRPDRYLRGGDHTAFNEQGFPAVRLTEYRENYDHQHQNLRRENGIEYGDLPKFVDRAYMANVARLNVAALASLASAPAPPTNVRLETKVLENDSTLVWEASPDALATGYEVLWRPTTSAEFDNIEAVGKVTRATIKRSKDNVNFAVRAVDGKGHRSLAVAPMPER